MKVNIKQELADAIGYTVLKEFGVDKNNWHWKGEKGQEIDLRRYSVMKALELKGAVTDHIRLKGARTMIRDIDAWVSSNKKEGGGGKPRNPDQFTAMAIKYFRNVPGQRVYEKDSLNDCWWAYYVSDISYHAPTRFNAAHCKLELHYKEFGSQFDHEMNFYSKDIRGKTILEAFTARGWTPETKELRERYLAEREVYRRESPLVGKQFLARGQGTDNLDGNHDEEERSWWRSTHNIRLDKQGEPSRVVMDLFQESDTTEKVSRYGHKAEDADDEVTDAFWVRELAKKANDAGKIETEDEEEDLLKDESSGLGPEIPIHLTVATFDLKRHLRLRVHISQLEEYKYDVHLGDKLVLPADSRALIDILLAQGSNSFKDIISGKGAGAVILSAGPPGTGKTLTAEAYAEVTGRPLYTVQCSQLGTDADELEANLLKSFLRSDRWNSILLLDEADVYVAARGNDLTQNAIVGVFLRTLEYYKGTMFMTTNRADLVDDAVASRCIARLEYKLPVVADQRKIWRVLADNAGIELKDSVIKQIVDKNDKLSGRDIKNLLKLAQLIGAARNQPIDADLIQFVKRYKPTGDVHDNE